MPSDLLELVGALFELLDFLGSWRFWLPIGMAVAASWILLETVPQRGAAIALSVAVVASGCLLGLRWHLDGA